MTVSANWGLGKFGEIQKQFKYLEQDSVKNKNEFSAQLTVTLIKKQNIFLFESELVFSPQKVAERFD